MTTTILASFPSPAQGVWHLGPIPIRAYAVCIIIGIIAALLIGDRRWVARGGERGVIYDIALWAVPFGLIGGRLYHVMTDWKTYFGPGGAGPLAALRVWDGGLGIWGAVALGGVGAWIACRRRGIPLPAFGDAVAPGIVLAQAIGRIGNYFNQELYGRPTTVPWGMEIFNRQEGQGPSAIVDVHSLNGVSTGQVVAIVHPTFLYELLWNLLVFVILIVIDRKYRIGHGRLFALYVALYCVGRFCVELLRDDTATHIAGIRINSFTSTFVFLGAVVYIVLAKKGREDPRTLGGNEEYDDAHVPELARELAGVAAGTGVVAAATVAGREDIDPDEAETLDVLETVDELESGDEFEPLEEDTADLVGGEVVAEGGEIESDEVVVGDGVVVGDDEPEDEVATEADLSESAESADSAGETDVVDDSDHEAALEGVEPLELEADEPEVISADEFVVESSDAVLSDAVLSETVLTGDADDIDPDTEDESVVEAEIAAPGVEVETADDVEEQLIDEDHDPVDEDELEGLADVEVIANPVSEQVETLETVADDADSAMVVYYPSDDDAADDGVRVVYAADDDVAVDGVTVVYASGDEVGDDVEVETAVSASAGVEMPDESESDHSVVVVYAADTEVVVESQDADAEDEITEDESAEDESAVDEGAVDEAAAEETTDAPASPARVRRSGRERMFRRRR